MDTEDNNPNPEVLYTVNVDTQKINIVVDKDIPDKSGKTEQPAVDIEKKMESGTQTEKPSELKASTLR